MSGSSTDATSPTNRSPRSSTTKPTRNERNSPNSNPDKRPTSDYTTTRHLTVLSPAGFIARAPQTLGPAGPGFGCTGGTALAADIERASFGKSDFLFSYQHLRAIEPASGDMLIILLNNSIPNRQRRQPRRAGAQGLVRGGESCQLASLSSAERVSLNINSNSTPGWGAPGRDHLSTGAPAAPA